MNQDLQKQISILKYYVAFLSVLVIGLIAFLFLKETDNRFKEITAERINIVESNDKLRMVISNQNRQHPGIIDGKVLAQREREAGIIFFNTDGDECGGLVFDGNKNGGGMAYSVDQYRNDQIMQLQYQEEANEKQRLRSYGLKFWDRSDDFTLGDLLRKYDSLKRLNDTSVYRTVFGKLKSRGYLGNERLFLGKTKSSFVGLFIHDTNGRPRIEIGLDKDNNVVLQVRDTLGRVRPFAIP
jgi:hypothetical protein